MLREAGVEVVTGVLEEEARALNPAFMTFQMRKRPYVYLKWAQSADGFMDARRADVSEPPLLLSSAETLRRVHRLRSEVAAIMVGTRTALLDNPSLTVRHWAGHSPVRVVLDRTLKLPSASHVLDGTVRTLVFTAVEAESGPNVEYVRIDFGQDVLPQVLLYLYEQNYDKLVAYGMLGDEKDQKMVKRVDNGRGSDRHVRDPGRGDKTIPRFWVRAGSCGGQRRGSGGMVRLVGGRESGGRRREL